MKKTFLALLVAMFSAFNFSAPALAAPDQYCGDTSLYGGAPTVLKPNVLIFIDDSGSMASTVPSGSYDPAVTYTVTSNCANSSGAYPRACSTNAVYRTTNGGSSGGTFLNSDVNNITTSCSGYDPQTLLKTYGTYNGSRLNSDGSCNTSTGRTYVTGNYVNWYHSSAAGWTPKVQVARNVITNLINTTQGVNFGLMTFHYPNSWTYEGSQFLSTSVSGVSYVTTIKDMDGIHTGTTTNRQALVAAVNTLTSLYNTALGESLFESMRYFQGGQTAFSNTIGVDASGYYTSPIQWGCQKNYVIFVTDGMSNSDNNTVMNPVLTKYGRWDGGNCDTSVYTTCSGSDMNHSLAGTARYMYETDLRTDITGTQNVTTYTIGFGLGGADQEAIDLLKLTADSNHGRGAYYNAGSETELSAALTTVIGNIFSVDTSFVAPVVPVSPENRTYSGSRVYMGFFKPASGKFWSGNLKKFALDNDNNILDSNGNYANYIDSNQNGFDDRDNASLGSNANGSFRSTSQSYWSTIADSGVVEEGGIGEVLLNRTTTRNIYTFLGTSTQLSHSSNAFTTSVIGETRLGFTSGDTASRDKLIDFLYGVDTYDADSDTNVTEKRQWILGDILHSKPQIVSYNTYTYSHETDCSGTFVSGASSDNANNTYIFVGANDGMLHAFKDCDGSEAWAFIPPDLLPVLQYLGPTGGDHTYFVDFSPSVYIYNKDKTGNINATNGDKAILVFGLRRGGGLSTSPTKGYYYALDITNPLDPIFLGSISNTEVRNGLTTTASTDFSELGEVWSDISFGKIKHGSDIKIATFIGAGYDNCNEDGRYGSTQTFSGSCVAPPTSDSGAVTSSGSTTPLNPKGRGIYVIEIAQINTSTGNLSFANTGTKIWGYTNADNPSSMIFSIPSKVKTVDTNYDNYIDRLYVGDTGGNMWRINIKDTSPTNWTVNKIFNANPGYSNGVADASNGRKIFYEPSAFVLTDGSVRLYFGTGDREHPLNTAVIDRMYSLIDRGQTTAASINEINLVDVTDDTLQGLSTTQTQAQAIINQLISASKYGWYIRLNENTGEKVLAPSVLYNAVAVYTTYSPLTIASTDPCVTGNLGTARAYAVDYLTGAAVTNYDTTNDTTSTTNTWARASGTTFNLLRSDRVVTLGSGIPSGGVVVISSTGQTSLMIGVGGSFQTMKLGGSSATLQLYWRQKMEHL